MQCEITMLLTYRRLKLETGSGTKVKDRKIAKQIECIQGGWDSKTQMSELAKQEPAGK